MKRIALLTLPFLLMTCSQDTDQIVSEIQSPALSTTKTVTYRSDFPAQLKGKKIWIDFKDPNVDRGENKRAWTGACKRLTGATGVGFTYFQEYADTHPNGDILRIEVYEHTGDSICGGAATDKVNGLYTEIRIETSGLAQSLDWRRSLFLHELAHCLGLGHPDNTNFQQGYSYTGTGVMDGANCSNAANGNFSSVLNSAEFNTLSQLMYD